MQDLPFQAGTSVLKHAHTVYEHCVVPSDQCCVVDGRVKAPSSKCVRVFRACSTLQSCTIKLPRLVRFGTLAAMLDRVRTTVLSVVDDHITYLQRTACCLTLRGRHSHQLPDCWLDCHNSEQHTPCGNQCCIAWLLVIDFQLPAQPCSMLRSSAGRVAQRLAASVSYSHAAARSCGGTQLERLLVSTAERIADTFHQTHQWHGSEGRGFAGVAGDDAEETRDVGNEQVSSLA